MKVYGPYLSQSDVARPRRFVIRVYEDGRKKTTSYARHLMEEHLGRELESHEVVDHIDNDQLNDVIDNLQILTTAQNNQKSKSIEMYEFNCPVCGELAQKQARNVRSNWKKGKAGPFCGKSCARKYQLGKSE